METEFWEKEYNSLMGIAGSHLLPEWKFGEILVVKTAGGRILTVEIPDYQDHLVREPLENRCIEKLAELGDTQVFACLATINGKHPEIPSWNFRSGLIDLNEKNLQTQTFLWGGAENIHIKPFCSLLPPNYQTRKEHNNE